MSSERRAFAVRTPPQMRETGPRREALISCTLERRWRLPPVSAAHPQLELVARRPGGIQITGFPRFPLARAE